MRELDRAFLDAGVTGFPVCDGARLVGVISRSDIVRRYVSQQSYAEYVSDYFRADPGLLPPQPLASLDSATTQLDSTSVADMMSRDPITVAPDAGVREVAGVLGERGVHRVLVVDGDQLVGIISSLDIVRLVADGKPLD
jgi:CBS domain-containing protein